MRILHIAALWMVLQVVPLGIIYACYQFFQAQSFFGLEGAWKGVTAVGPIAAYVFIAWIWFRNFRELAQTFNPVERFDAVVGSWLLNAESINATKATGRCEVSTEDNRLTLQGTFEEDGRQIVIWSSDFAFIDGSRLFYVYKLETPIGSYVGYVRLFVTGASNRAQKVTKMDGDWVAVGAQLKRGKITFYR